MDKKYFLFDGEVREQCFSKKNFIFFIGIENNGFYRFLKFCEN
jgi:hypothetical protein